MPPPRWLANGSKIALERSDHVHRRPRRKGAISRTTVLGREGQGGLKISLQFIESLHSPGSSPGEKVVQRIAEVLFLGSKPILMIWVPDLEARHLQEPFRRFPESSSVRHG